jgi:hypothetical protein
VGTIQANRRQAKRYRIALPVELSAGSGITCDVSESGMLFETEQSMAAGENIVFSLVLGQYDRNGAFRLQCRGNIVRVERRSRRSAVAVRITSYGKDPAIFEAG